MKEGRGGGGKENGSDKQDKKRPWWKPASNTSMTLCFSVLLYSVNKEITDNPMYRRQDSDGTSLVNGVDGFTVRSVTPPVIPAAGSVFTVVLVA